jgi:hypothetical protein
MEKFEVLFGHLQQKLLGQPFEMLLVFDVQHLATVISQLDLVFVLVRELLENVCNYLVAFYSKSNRLSHSLFTVNPVAIVGKS